MDGNTSSTEHHDPRLNLLDKNELIKIIIAQKSEIVSVNEDFKKLTNLRLYHLERSHYIAFTIWKKGPSGNGWNTSRC